MAQLLDEGELGEGFGGSLLLRLCEQLCEHWLVIVGGFMIIGFWDQRLIMGEKISPGLIYLFTRFRNDLVDFKRFSYLKNDLICIGNYKNKHSINYHFSHSILHSYLNHHLP